jgi:serine/threonine-protein kinase RsbW
MPKNSIEVDIRVPNQTRYLSLIGKIGEDIVKGLNRQKYDKETLAYELNLVLTEAMVNAIRYGHESNHDQTVHIFITITDDELQVKVYDHGQGFDINEIQPPDFDNPDDQGRGIYIIKCIMDSVSYRKCDKFNVLEMSKRLR